MELMRRIFNRIKKQSLRDRVEAAYGTEFVEDIYDKLAEGAPVGGLLETVIYLELIDRIRRAKDE